MTEETACRLSLLPGFLESFQFGNYRHCRQDNSTVPGLPIQRSYGTHSHTTFPTLNSTLFWPVKAVGNIITMGIYNMSIPPPNKSFFISNYEITAHKNSANSYDSNGIKYMRIRGLYEEIRNLPGFVYMNGETPDRQILELRDVCYIVGRVFSR